MAKVKSLAPVEAYKLVAETSKRIPVDAHSFEAGIRDTYHVDISFERKLDKKHHRDTLGGWRYHGLPWEQCWFTAVAGIWPHPW